MRGRRGRGRNYTRNRGLLEALLHRLFVADWPARLWAAIPGTTDVTCVEHTVACLPDGVSVVRMGFVSDIHIGPTTPIETIEAGFGRLRRAAPDVLLLGGDYVFLDATDAKARVLGELVDSVPARVKLAVLGNHDLWDRHEILERELVGRGVEILTNRSVTLPSPFDGVTIVGLDDPWTGTPDAGAAFGACPPDATIVALCHAPEGIEHLRGRNASLLLCGHTHGGQIAVPDPLYVHGPVGRRYWAGRHRVDGIELIVSRGIGGIEIPVRIGAPPEVALITLVSGT